MREAEELSLDNHRAVTIDHVADQLSQFVLALMRFQRRKDRRPGATPLQTAAMDRVEDVDEEGFAVESMHGHMRTKMEHPCK